jgi:cytochrome c oxidase subunit III
MAHQTDHDFYIPAGSIWPPLSCFGAGLMAFGFVGHLHFQPAVIGNSLMAFGLLLILIAALQWFLEMTYSARVRGFTKGAVPLVQDLGQRYGMIFFIVSEIMFFSAFFAGYFYLRAHNPEWPPANILKIPVELPLLATLLLLTSGATVTWAHHALLNNRRSEAILATKLTWLLGVIFLGVQAYEYHHLVTEGMGLSSGVFGSVFYMITGFHGFHVFIGSLMLMWVHWRLHKGEFSRHHHFYFEAAAWYWHFVDVVWIGLFLFIYVL